MEPKITLSQLSRAVQYAFGFKTMLRKKMQWHRLIPNEKYEKLAFLVRIPRIRRTWSFGVVVLQRIVQKYTKIYNARAQLLFCSLNLLFGDVLVVVVVVCLSSLMSFLLRPCVLLNLLVRLSCALGKEISAMQVKMKLN